MQNNKMNYNLKILNNYLNSFINKWLKMRILDLKIQNFLSNRKNNKKMKNQKNIGMKNN